MEQNNYLIEWLNRKFAVDYASGRWNIQTVPYSTPNQADIKPSYTKGKTTYNGDTITVEWVNEINVHSPLPLFRVTMIPHLGQIPSSKKNVIAKIMRDNGLGYPVKWDFFEYLVPATSTSIDLAIADSILNQIIDSFIGVSIQLALYRSEAKGK